MDFSTLEVSYGSARDAITLKGPDKLNPLRATTVAELVEAARFFDASSRW